MPRKCWVSRVPAKGKPGFCRLESAYRPVCLDKKTGFFRWRVREFPIFFGYWPGQPICGLRRIGIGFGASGFRIKEFKGLLGNWHRLWCKPRAAEPMVENAVEFELDYLVAGRSDPFTNLIGRCVLNDILIALLNYFNESRTRSDEEVRS